MMEIPSTRLLPGFDFILMHGNFLNKLAYFCQQYQEYNAGEKFLNELQQFVKKIKEIQTVNELEVFISKESLLVAKNYPKDYYKQGYTKSSHLFYSLPVSIEENDLGAIYFFFPVIFKKHKFITELTFCSHAKHFPNPKDIRCLEVYDATYAPPLRVSFTLTL